MRPSVQLHHRAASWRNEGTSAQFASNSRGRTAPARCNPISAKRAHIYSPTRAHTCSITSEVGIYFCPAGAGIVGAVLCPCRRDAALARGPDLGTQSTVSRGATATLHPAAGRWRRWRLCCVTHYSMPLVRGGDAQAPAEELLSDVGGKVVAATLAAAALLLLGVCIALALRTCRRDARGAEELIVNQYYGCLLLGEPMLDGRVRWVPACQRAPCQRDVFVGRRTSSPTRS